MNRLLSVCHLAGEAVARDHLFAACGWQPCIVPETEWNQLSTTAAQQDLLRCRLHEFGCLPAST